MKFVVQTKMSNEIIIRSALERDFADIAKIYAHAVLHTNASFEFDTPDQVEMLARYQDRLATGYQTL